VAHWDERYRSGEHGKAEPHPLLLQFVSNLLPGRALDVASGPGRHAIWLAERGWHVTAVDYSPAAIELLHERSVRKGVQIDACVADLESDAFVIGKASYDLIVVCSYLQRNLFTPIKDGTRIGGIVLAAIAMVDDDPNITPMNPAYLLQPGELRANFEGWALLHDFEGKPADDPKRRATAEIVARRLL
jgi:SAM-dependent methyltransferase